MTSTRRLAIFDATPQAYGGGYEQFAIKLRDAAETSGWRAEVVVPSTRDFLRVVSLLGVRKRFAHLAQSPNGALNWSFAKDATHAYIKNEPLDIAWWHIVRSRAVKTIGFHTPLRYPADTLPRKARNALYANRLYGALLSGSRLHMLNSREAADLPVNARLLYRAVIPNGIEIQDVVYDSPQPPFSLLFVGRITPQKGLDRLVPLFTGGAITESLTVVGVGQDAKPLTSRFGDRARFVGSFTRDQVLGLMREHSVLLMPSRWEGLPLVLLESMSVGCVPVISNISTLIDILPPELRWLCVDFENLENVKACLGRLKQLYVERTAWQRLRSQIVEHVRENYSEDVQLRKLLRFIEAETRVYDSRSY